MQMFTIRSCLIQLEFSDRQIILIFRGEEYIWQDLWGIMKNREKQTGDFTKVSADK